MASLCDFCDQVARLVGVDADGIKTYACGKHKQHLVEVRDDCSPKKSDVPTAYGGYSNCGLAGDLF